MGMTQQQEVQKCWQIVRSTIGDQYDLLDEDGKIMTANVYYADARFMKSLHEESEAQRIRADQAEQERDKLQLIIDEIDNACSKAQHSNFAEQVFDILLTHGKSKIL